jgi:hypothetical protein
VKFLAYMGVSMTTVDLLRQGGEAAVHMRDEGLHRLPDACRAELERGAIIIVEDERYRLRRLPIR